MTWSLTGTVGDARGSSAGRGRSRRARASSPVTGSLFDPDAFDVADASRDDARTTEAPAQPGDEGPAAAPEQPEAPNDEATGQNGAAKAATHQGEDPKPQQ